MIIDVWRMISHVEWFGLAEWRKNSKHSRFDGLFLRQLSTFSDRDNKTLNSIKKREVSSKTKKMICNLLNMKRASDRGFRYPTISDKPLKQHGDSIYISHKQSTKNVICKILNACSNILYSFYCIFEKILTKFVVPNHLLKLYKPITTMNTWWGHTYGQKKVLKFWNRHKVAV